MAVANSTIQLIIPGIDKLVADSFTSTLASNATVAAIQTNISNAGSITDIQNALSLLTAQVAELPGKDPLPTFATMSVRDNNPRYTVYNSDMREQYSAYPDTNAEMWSTWTGNNYTNGNIGSNGWTSYWMGATPFYQADTHWYWRLSEGWHTYPSMNPDGMNSYMPYWGVIIGNNGKRQKISVWSQNSTLRVMFRGVQQGYLEELNMNSSTYATWFGGTQYGMFSYNERTGTVVVIEAKDGNNNYRLHRWINTGTDRGFNKSNFKSGMLHRFLSEAKAGLTVGGGVASYNFYDFQWQANASQNYNESRYRMRIVVGDNGIVGMQRFVPSNITHYATYTPASQTLNTTFNTISNTTSYGIEQGEKYGARHMITWDNNWVAAYNVYYYYGSGMNVFFIDTRDPRNYFTGQYGSTDNGCALVPFQKNKFMWSYHISNSDGTSGQRLAIVDLEGPLKYGRTLSGTITNGANIDLTKNIMSGIFDTKYTSTNYTWLMPMARWMKNI